MILRSFSWFPNAQIDISAICVTHRLFDAFEPWLFGRRGYGRIYFTAMPPEIGEHACAASTEVEQLILDFLESEAKVSTSSQTMVVAGRYSGYRQKALRQMIGVHVAAYFGLREVMIVRQAGRVDHPW
jgi:hypothetical protein